MLNNINARGISNKGNVKVFNHPGATCEDLKDHINPSIKRKLNILICHIGTNDLSKNVDTITELQTIINRVKRKSPHSKLAFSSCLVWKDCPKLGKKVTHLNNSIKKLCNENLIDFISNENIDESCLGKGKLHPNKKGKSFFANNLIKYIDRH